MSKRNAGASRATTTTIAGKRRKKQRSRSGAAWRPARGELSDVERACVVAVLELRDALGREPRDAEIAERVGLSSARAALARVRSLGLTRALSQRQSACLGAILALEARLGHSPSTREVSAEMGLSPAGSRFHIAQLAAMGLVTPPEMRLVLSVTPAGIAAHRRAAISAAVERIAKRAPTGNATRPSNTRKRRGAA